MKDITSRHLLRAESDDAGESLATRIPDAPSATKKKPAPPTFSAASLGGSRHFTYRSTNQSAALRGQMLVGAVYDGHDDRMTHVMDAIIDEVSVYDRVLSAEEVTSMQGRTPCAKRYASDGYAYFPGLTAAHGPEWLAMDNIPACKSGPHTVRVNYLVSEGNNRRLSLTSRDQNSRTVNFPQPFGFDTADMHTWQGLL